MNSYFLNEFVNLIKLINQGPNEKVKKFSEELLKFYNEMMKKGKDFDIFRIYYRKITENYYKNGM